MDEQHSSTDNQYVMANYTSFGVELEHIPSLIARSSLVKNKNPGRMAPGFYLQQ
jgi:hypothetical protein